MDGQIPLILIGLYILTIINVLYLVAFTLALFKQTFLIKVSMELKRWFLMTSTLSILIVVASLETIVFDTFISKASVLVSILVLGAIWGVSKGYLKADLE